jgi:hypothetical protein
MSAPFRVGLITLAPIFFAAVLRAQPAPLPPIFAPRVKPAPPAPIATAPSLVSERARLMINTAAARMLATAEPFDAPTDAHVVVDTASGTLVMAPLVVRSNALHEAEIRPPELRLGHFTRARADKHLRIAGGVTAPLYHTIVAGKELQVDFNILNGAGNGIDHNRDFTRVELAFTFKW